MASSETDFCFSFRRRAALCVSLIPFIILFGAILNWVLNVIEGVAAAPFLAFAHLDTDGEGLGQKTSHGYGFMLQSFMCPVMIVLGFVVASLVVDAMGYFLTQIYPTVIANAQANSWTGMLSIIGYIAFFFVMALGLVNSSFSIIYLLPDAIFSFMVILQSPEFLTKPAFEVPRKTNGQIADDCLGTFGERVDEQSNGFSCDDFARRFHV